MTAHQNDGSRSPSWTTPRSDPRPAAYRRPRGPVCRPQERGPLTGLPVDGGDGPAAAGATGAPPPAPRHSLTYLVAHGEDIGRTGLRLTIDCPPGLVVTAEAADGEQATLVACPQRPNVVVVDLRLPGVTGAPDQATPPERLVAAAVRILLLRVNQPDVLVTAVRAAHGEQVELDPGLLASLVDPRRVPELPPAVTGPRGRALCCGLGSLSPREREVLVALATGRSNRQLAADLRVKESTIKTHVNRLLTKLALRSRTEAAALAYQLGCVQRPDWPVSPIPDG